jgi:hypothetical protein
MAIRQGPGLAIVAFTVTYAAAYEVTNWGTVYLLDWWDPKFGDRLGNVAVGHQIMPLFLVVAVASFLVAVRWHRLWLRTAPNKLVVFATVTGAFLVQSIELLWGLAFRDVQTGPATTIAGWILLLGGPALFSGAAFAFARWRDQSGTAPGRT